TFMFGLLASVLPRIYKFVGIALLVLAMAGLVFWIDYRQRQRGVQIKLGGPVPEPKSGNEKPLDEGTMDERRDASSEYELIDRLQGRG
ncbi:MAG TPA: hypothetical protein VFN02_08270, partial [Ktedonobacteraceae bacterium]|nr:hypothetical protein [Ktedonobacteraceae bacterium]